PASARSTRGPPPPGPGARRARPEPRRPEPRRPEPVTGPARALASRPVRPGWRQRPAAGARSRTRTPRRTGPPAAADKPGHAPPPPAAPALAAEAPPAEAPFPEGPAPKAPPAEAGPTEAPADAAPIGAPHSSQ